MIDIDIPGFKELKIEYLVLDYNGTIATDGIFNQNLKDKISILSKSLKIYILTADTFNSVKNEMRDYPVEVWVLKSDNHTKEKMEFIQKLGMDRCCAIGNGANDEMMIESAGLGIVVSGDEGCCVSTLMKADIMVKDICDAMNLLINPDRLRATLRR